MFCITILHYDRTVHSVIVWHYYTLLAQSVFDRQFYTTIAHCREFMKDNITRHSKPCDCGTVLCLDSTVSSMIFFYFYFFTGKEVKVLIGYIQWSQHLILKQYLTFPVAQRLCWYGSVAAHREGLCAVIAVHSVRIGLGEGCCVPSSGTGWKFPRLTWLSELERFSLCVQVWALMFE